MKGIPAPCIKYDAQQRGITVLDVYKKSSKNKAMKFDSINGNAKFVVCRNNTNYTVSNVSDFIRKCQYIRDGSDNLFVD